MKPEEEDEDDDHLAYVEWKSTIQLMGMRGVGKKNNHGEALVLGFQHYVSSLEAAVYLPSRFVGRMGGTDKFLRSMQTVQGSIIIGSAVEIILGFSQGWGICTRESWSFICFYALTYVCRNLLCLIGACGISGPVSHAVHEYELYEEHVHHRGFYIYGLICSPILHGLLIIVRPSSSFHQSGLVE